MIRKLGLGISVLALLVPGFACALGVGNYQLRSYLNQPLSMDIALTGAEDLSSDDIVVNLASQQEFDNAGVNRAGLLNDLRFEVSLKGDGNGSIHISTVGTVSEPYMDFLVQILWPTGRILREYTILLDPPSYDSADAASNTIAIAAPEAPAQVSTPAASQPEDTFIGGTSAQETVVVTPPASVATDTTVATGTTPTPAATVPAANDSNSKVMASGSSTASYTVKAGDTLWQVASRYRPSTDVSMQQMVMAIQRANPEAFYVKGNANFLNEGAVLRIPEENDVRQYNTREAMDSLAQQNRRWREILAERGISVPAGDQINAGSGQVQRIAAGAGSSSRGEVKLLAGQSEDSSQAGGSAGKLQDQLALKAENVDKLNQENEELSSRIEELKQQVVTSDKLLELRNSQIASLQVKLRELQKQGVKVDQSLLEEVKGEVSKPAAATEEATAVTTPAEPAEVTSGEPEAKPEVAAVTAETVQPQAAVDKKPVATPAPKAAEPEEQGLVAGLMDFIANNLMLIGLVLLLLVLGAAALVMRKRQQEKAVEAVELDGEDTAGGDEDFLGGGLLDDHADEGSDDVAEADDDVATPAKRQTQDPLEQLEVYIAYGRFPQAIDFLRDEISRAPGRKDLKIRLLEVEKEAGDDTAFAKDSARFAGDGGEVDACIARLSGGSAEEPSLDDLESDLSAPVHKPAAAPAAKQDDDFSGFHLDDAPLSGMDGDIKPSSRHDEPLDFGRDSKTKEAQPAETFELDDAFTLDEGDLGGGKGTELSDADISAMDDTSVSLGLDEDFDLDQPASAKPQHVAHDEEIDLSAALDADGDDIALESAAPASAPADDTFELADVDAMDDLTLDEPAPAPAPAPVSAPKPVAAPAPAPAPVQKPAAASTDLGIDLGNDDFAFLGDADENATKLDLARAYIEMGDHEGAKDLLNEVVGEGSAQQQSEARELLAQVG